MSQLQANAPIHSYSYSSRVCAESFPDAYNKTLFLNEKIIGSGSMAQVHSGYILNKDGSKTEVAVKIIHPRVHDIVYCDLMIMSNIASLVNHLPGGYHWLGLSDAVTEFSEFIENHLNLINEGNSLRRMAKDFKDWPQIGFPVPVEGYTSKLVLVETLERGRNTFSIQVALANFLFA
jgi:aarF domain-containing kinase